MTAPSCVAAVRPGLRIVRGIAPRIGYWSLFAAGLVATLAATVVVTRVARRALERDTDIAEEME